MAERTGGLSSPCPGYESATLVGVGAFAHVYAARARGCGARVAVKRVACSRHDSDSDRRRLLREIKILRELRGCGTVCQLRRVVVLGGDGGGASASLSGRDVLLVTELAQTDLHAALFSAAAAGAGGPGASWLTVAHAQLFLYQLLCALKFTHSAGIVHRDINLRNLLVNANGDLRLCDFGLATHAFDGLEWRLQKTKSDALLPSASLAPEVLLQWKRCGKPADVWAAGVVLATLLNVLAASASGGAAAAAGLTAGNSGPFRTADPLTDTGQLVEVFRVVGLPDQRVLKNIRMVASSRAAVDAATREFNARLAEPGNDPGGRPCGWNKWCSENGLATHLLRFDAKQRPTAAQALEHEWFQELRNDLDEPGFAGNARDVEAIFRDERDGEGNETWFATELDRLAAADVL